MRTLRGLLRSFTHLINEEYHTKIDLLMGEHLTFKKYHLMQFTIIEWVHRLILADISQHLRWPTPYCNGLKVIDAQVVNWSDTVQYEVSKLKQYLAMKDAWLLIPDTIAIQWTNLPESVFKWPYIVKPNRWWKGTDVQKCNSREDVESALSQCKSLDGLTLIQQYIQPPSWTITRLEFVGWKFLYVVEIIVNSFELCPADACSIDVCPVTSQAQFTIQSTFDTSLIEKCELLLKTTWIDIAWIECVQWNDWKRYFYDLNTNTNYNSEAEVVSWNNAMKNIVEYLVSLGK